MHKVRRTTVATLAALVLAAPGLTACNRTGVPSTCDSFSLSATAGGKGGKSGGKSSTTKTKPKTGTAPKVGHIDTDDECDDD